MALDANSNATEPTLPVVPPPKTSKPIEPDPLVQMFPKNIPHWFVITYTYSVVLIVILLIANSTPDGKLYIHFTAFWSLILYFVLEDEQVGQKNKNGDLTQFLEKQLRGICHFIGLRTDQLFC